jgi:hypothetical protein
VLSLGLLLPPAHAQKTISINFNSTHAFTESDNVRGKSKKSALTNAQKKAVIANVQKEYDDALGPGIVKVEAGKAGDVKMIVNGGRAPGANKGKEYGDAGKPGKAGLAHEGEFLKNGFADDGLVNAIAETLAHEAAHKLGIAQHNLDNPPSKMTKGDMVDDAQRKADMRKFTAHDIATLKKTLGIANPEQKDSFAPGLNVFRGEDVDFPPNIPDDRFLDVLVNFTGLTGAEFGYISGSGDFVWQGDWTDNPYPGVMTFIYSAAADLAVMVDGEVFSLGEHEGSFLLSHLNPDNPAVYLDASLSFATPRGTVDWTLDASAFRTTGGFFAVVPEPDTLVFLVLAVTLLLPFASRQSRRR